MRGAFLDWILMRLPGASPTVTVEPYPTRGGGFRIRIRNPFGHPIHIGRVVPLHPLRAPDVVCRVEVDGWEMNPRAVRRRLGVFLDAGREMTIAFSTGSGVPEAVILALSWGRRRAAPWPLLPHLVVRTRAQMAALQAQAAAKPGAKRPPVFGVPALARRSSHSRPVWPRLVPAGGHREESATASRRSPSGARAHRWPAPDPWLRVRPSGG